MCGNILCLVVAVLGVDTGWQSLPGGGVRYLIQIEPEMLDSLKAGEAIESDIPPEVRDVREYRITVGTGTVPRELPPLPERPAQEADAKKKSAKASAGPALTVPAEAGKELLIDEKSLPPLETRLDEAKTPSASPGAPPAHEHTLPAELPSTPPVEETPIPTAPDLSGHWPPPPPGVRPDLDAVTAPGALPDDVTGKPLVEPVAATVPSVPEPAAKRASPTPPPKESRPSPETGAKPWMPLMFTLLLLFASLGGNAYLLWIAGDLRRRYRNLLTAGGGGPL